MKDQRDLDEIGHMLKNIAQKHLYINNYRKTIVTMQVSIDKDMDRIWEIINRNGKKEGI